MSVQLPTLRSHAPAAWAFHRASARYPFNMLAPDADESPEPGKEDPQLAYRPLAAPALIGNDLETAIAGRYSCRDFSPESLGEAEVSALLHHALGAVGTALFGRAEMLRRPCPSPGGLYPLELYLIARRIEGIEQGIYHYHGQTHSVGQVRAGLPPPGVESWIFMDQPYAASGAASLVITCMFGRSLKKYRDRGYRYALIEAGHVGQNIALLCSALGLGCCPLGGFFDDEVGDLLKLDGEQEAPLYALSLGRPRPDEEQAGRDAG